MSEYFKFSRDNILKSKIESRIKQRQNLISSQVSTQNQTGNDSQKGMDETMAYQNASTMIDVKVNLAEKAEKLRAANISSFSKPRSQSVRHDTVRVRKYLNQSERAGQGSQE